MTPIPSEAAPTLKIAGVDAGVLVLNGPNCLGADTGFSQCWSIPGTAGAGKTFAGTSNTWTLADVSVTNKARVLINDQNIKGAVDALKLTGVKITPVNSGAQQTSVVITNTYNSTSPQGLPAGDLVWGMSQNGFFDPIGLDTANDNRLLNTADGVVPSVALGRLDTGTIQNAAAGANKSVTATLAARTVLLNCNTNSSGRCIPQVTVTYQVTITSNDTLVLNDSFIIALGTCRENEPPPDVPPGPPDTLPVGPVCRGYQNQVDLVLHKDVIDGQKSAKAAGATPMEKCTSACGHGTIVINKDSGLFDATFAFSGTGEDVAGGFDITTRGGTGSKSYNNISTGPIAGPRTITEMLPPSTSGFWHLEDVSCWNTGGENSTSWNQLLDDGEAPIGVTVSNLDENDTLTCTFTNALHSY